MARWPLWEQEEILLVLDLYARQGPHPAREAVYELSELLRAKRPTDARRDRRFRSVGGIETQLYNLSLLDREDPRAETVPRRVRSVWDEFRERLADVPAQALLLREETEPLEQTRYAPDRRELRFFLQDLRLLLQDMVDARRRLMPEQLEADFLAAWTEINRRQVFEEAFVVLRDPAVEEGLEREGLVEREGRLKRIPVTRWLARWRQTGGLDALKHVLKWANVYLGSLAKVIAVLGAVKEFKEVGEAGLEEVLDQDPAP